MSLHFSQLTELEFGRGSAAKPFIDAFFGSDDRVVRNLTSLALHHVDHEMAKMICRAPGLVNLTSLSIEMAFGQKDRDDAFNCLVQSPYLFSSNLKHLSLRSFGNLTRDSFQLFTAALENANVQLQSLDLWHTIFPFDGLLTALPAFSNSRHCRKMKHT